MEPIAAIGRRLVAALRDQFAPGFAAQLLQQVQLLVETLGATPQTAFTQLRQILHAAVSIKLPADAANRLAAKDGLQPTHDTRRASNGVFGEFYLGMLNKGMKPEMARLTLARKIAAISFKISKKGEAFDAGHLKSKAA